MLEIACAGPSRPGFSAICIMASGHSRFPPLCGMSVAASHLSSWGSPPPKRSAKLLKKETPSSWFRFIQFHTLGFCWRKGLWIPSLLPAFITFFVRADERLQISREAWELLFLALLLGKFEEPLRQADACLYQFQGLRFALHRP